MAEWKKVIVSGSSAHLSTLQVGSNQQIGTTQATTWLTGSFTGSHSGSFSGNGSGLSNITATFPSTQLTPLTATTQVFVNDGSNKYVTAGQIMTGSYGGVSGDITINSSGVSAIGASKVTSAMILDGTIAGGDIASATVANTNLVNSGSIIGSTPLVLGTTVTTVAGLTSVTSTNFVGNLTGSAATASFVAVGNVSGLGTGVATALAANVGSAGAPVVFNGALGTPSAGTLTNATGLPLTGLVSDTSTALGIGSINLGHATDTTITRASAGNINIEGNLVATSGNTVTFTNKSISLTTNPLSGTVAEFNTALSDDNFVTLTGAETLTNKTLTSPNLTTPNIGAATGTSLTLTGDLTVQGTTTILDTTNLSVEDRFVILNHGSGSIAPSAEGGIIVEGGAAGSGSAFYYDGDTVLRWGVALGVAEGATSITANSYVTTVSQSAGAPTGNPTYGGTAGYGNMYINSSNQDIYIYA